MFRKTILSILLIFSFLSATYGGNLPDADQSIKNLEIFANCYGIVRWFYPSDEIQNINWDNLAFYGISCVEKCQTNDELKNELENIFYPIAPGVQFSETPNFDISSITPPDTTNLVVVSWQHYGVDLGLYSNRYVSKRTNRELNTLNTSRLALEWSMSAAELIGSEVTISIPIKKTTNDLDVYFRASVINSVDVYEAVSFCASDIQPISNDGLWQTYSYTLKIDETAGNSNIKCGIYTDGTGKFSMGDFQINIKPDVKINLVNIYQNPLVYDYEFVNGYWDVSTKNMLFDDYAKVGDIASVKLVDSLYCHIPIALFGSKTFTYPYGDTKKVDSLNNIIASYIPSEKDKMIADIIIAWNVIKYFSPYLAEQQISWDNALKETLDKVSEYDGYNQRPLSLMLAKINDAHVNLNVPQNRVVGSQRYIPLRIIKIDNRIIVKESFIPDILRGDIINAVNDKDATDSFRYFEEAVSGSQQYKQVVAEPLWLTSFSDSQSITLDISRKNEKITVSLSPMNRDDFFKHLRESNSTKKSVWLNDSTLYINTLSTDFETIVNLLGKRSADQTVIIDVRGNSRFMFNNILNYLVDSDDFVPQRIGISNIPEVIYPVTPVIEDNAETTNPKIPNSKNIFLIGPENISNYEETIDYIRYAGLGLLIGTNTGGCNGAINVIVLPSGINVYFTGTKVFSNSGKDYYYYGKGIKPHIYSDITIEDIISGRDSAMEAALNVTYTITK